MLNLFISRLKLQGQGVRRLAREPGWVSYCNLGLHWSMISLIRRNLPPTLLYFWTWKLFKMIRRERATTERMISISLIWPVWHILTYVYVLILWFEDAPVTSTSRPTETLSFEDHHADAERLAKLAEDIVSRHSTDGISLRHSVLRRVQGEEETLPRGLGPLLFSGMPGDTDLWSLALEVRSLLLFQMS